MRFDLLSRAHILKYHNDSIKKFGLGSNEALGWKDTYHQRVRFEALVDYNKLSGHSVLDVGCGKGDLLAFLNEKKIDCTYAGIDQIKDFIELAGEKYKAQSNVCFLLGDFWTSDLGQYDYVLASGALSYRNSDSNFIYKMIAHLFGLSKIAFSFNLMEHFDLKDGNLVAYNKLDILAFCKKLSANVILKDDYLEGNFTIIMS
jgi:SAM-dependent methyltransferase